MHATTAICQQQHHECPIRSHAPPRIDSSQHVFGAGHYCHGCAFRVVVQLYCPLDNVQRQVTAPALVVQAGTPRIVAQCSISCCLYRAYLCVLVEGL